MASEPSETRQFESYSASVQAANMLEPVDVRIPASAVSCIANGSGPVVFPLSVFGNSRCQGHQLFAAVKTFKELIKKEKPDGVVQSTDPLRANVLMVIVDEPQKCNAALFGVQKTEDVANWGRRAGNGYIARNAAFVQAAFEGKEPPAALTDCDKPHVQDSYDEANALISVLNHQGAAHGIVTMRWDVFQEILFKQKLQVQETDFNVIQAIESMIDKVVPKVAASRQSMLQNQTPALENAVTAIDDTAGASIACKGTASKNLKNSQAFFEGLRRMEEKFIEKHGGNPSNNEMISNALRYFLYERAVFACMSLIEATKAHVVCYPGQEDRAMVSAMNWHGELKLCKTIEQGYYQLWQNLVVRPHQAPRQKKGLASGQSSNDSSTNTSPVGSPPRGPSPMPPQPNSGSSTPDSAGSDEEASGLSFSIVLTEGASSNLRTVLIGGNPKSGLKITLNYNETPPKGPGNQGFFKTPSDGALKTVREPLTQPPACQ